MKKMVRRIFSILLVLLMCTSMLPVSTLAAEAQQPEPAQTAEAVSLKETKSKAAPTLSGGFGKTAPGMRWSSTMEYGAKEQAQIHGVSIVSAVSSNKAVADVTKTGKITAKKLGTATITFLDASANPYYCDVTVVGKLSAHEATLAVGDSKTLSLQGAKFQSARSDDDAIASITEKGKVTANGKGQTNVYLIDVNGTEYSCRIQVENPRMQEMVLIQGRAQSAELLGNSQPVSKWSSSKSTVVSVNAKGVLQAKKAGECTITAQVASGKKVTARVTVIPGLAKDRMTLCIGDSSKIVLNGVKLRSVESRNPNVVSVEGSGKNIGKLTALAQGTAEIVVKDGYDQVYSCRVTVEDPSLALDTVSLEKGETVQMALDGTIQDCTWKSSKTSVAAVNADGLVTAKGVGSANITAKLTSGKTLTAKVTVRASLRKDRLVLATGDSAAIKLTAGKIVSADCDKQEIARVTSAGKVTALRAGEAAVTVRDALNNTYTCTVVCEDPVLETADLTMGQGRTQLLQVSGTEQGVKWTASGAVKVAKNGLVTTSRTGSGKVTATLDSGKKLTAALQVIPWISQTELAIAVGERGTLTLKGTTLVSAESMDPSIASVTPKGVVTAVAEGNTQVVLHGKNGEDYVCAIYAEDPFMEQETVDVTLGKSETLVLLNNSQEVTWKSANSKIATVNSSGNVAGLKLGTTTVKATLRSGRQFVFTVNVVQEKVYTVSFDTDGAPEIPAQAVTDGAAAQIPATPVKEGYVFVGWYEDPQRTREFNFSSRVKKDMILYARWMEAEEQEGWTISRGEWVNLLAGLVDMNLNVADIEGVNRYYADTLNHEYGIAIETFQAYGLLPPVQMADETQDVPRFRPDEPADREFVAYTTAKALGAETAELIVCADLADIIYLNEVSYVVQQDILRIENNRFRPKAWLSHDEMTLATGAICRVLDAAIDREEGSEYTYAPTALKRQFEEVTNYTFCDNGDDTYTLTMPNSAAARQVVKGNVIVMPETAEYPSGAALKVTSMFVNGDNMTFNGIAPEFAEIFTSFQFVGSGVSTMRYAVAAEDFTVAYDENGSVDHSDMPISANSYEGEIAPFATIGGTIGLPGKLTFSTDGAKIAGGELKGSIEVSIPEVTCIADIDASLLGGIDINEFIISLRSNIKFKADMKYTLTESGYKSGSGRFISCRKEIGSIPVPLPGGLSFDIQFFINYSANGSISLSYSIDSTVGYALTNGTGRWINNFADSLDMLELKGSAYFTVGVAPAIGYASIFEVFGFTIEMGPAFNASVTVHTLATDSLVCTDVTLYLMGKAGIDQQTIVGKILKDHFHYTLEKTFLDNNKDNPVKCKLHLENLTLVDECTFGKGRLEGVVVSAATKERIPNARVQIYSERSELIRTKYTDENGMYDFDNLTSGTYNITISADDYMRYDMAVVIDDGQTTYAQTAEMVARTDEIGTVRVTVIDATNGRPVDGAMYTVHKNWNDPTGSIVKSGTAYSNVFELELAAGNYTLQLSKDGYSTRSENVTVIAAASSEVQASLSPADQDIGQGTNMRIVLTWGEMPYDLDSHLLGRNSDGSRYHIYYSDRYAYENNQELANLDRDDTNSYGPETVTINTLHSGVYSYYVHDFTNRSYSLSSEMSNSGAKVDVYIGNTLVRTFNIPVNKIGTLWHVFDYDADTNRITAKNDFYSESNPGNVGRYALAEEMTQEEENLAFMLDALQYLEPKDTETPADSTQPAETEPDVTEPAETQPDIIEEVPEEAAEPEEAGILAVHVMDAQGSDLGGAAYTVTNASGEIVAEGILEDAQLELSLEAGAYILRLELEGYDPIEAKVTVISDACANVEAFLDAAGMTESTEEIEAIEDTAAEAAQAEEPAA